MDILKQFSMLVALTKFLTLKSIFNAKKLQR